MSDIIKDLRKILFLDIDGVMISHRFLNYCMLNGIEHNSHGVNWYFDPIAIKALKYIVKKTDCKIVISSTWRGNMDSVYEVFKDNCIDSTPIIGRTGYHPERIRGKDIQQWLRDQGLWVYNYNNFEQQAKDIIKSNIFSYCILEDEPSDIFFTQGDYLCNVSMKNGLTMNDAKRAVKILNNGVLKTQKSYVKKYDKN